MKLITLIVLAGVLEAQSVSPLVGTWQGTSSYTNGVDRYTVHFRFIFSSAHGRVSGSFHNLDERVRDVKVKILEISSDNRSYRMNVGDECWNINVDGDQLHGMRNGGRCTVAGVGSAARLIQVDATRITP